MPNRYRATVAQGHCIETGLYGNVPRDPRHAIGRSQQRSGIAGGDKSKLAVTHGPQRLCRALIASLPALSTFPCHEGRGNRTAESHGAFAANGDGAKRLVNTARFATPVIATDRRENPSAGTDGNKFSSRSGDAKQGERLAGIDGGPMLAVRGRRKRAGRADGDEASRAKRDIAPRDG